MEQTLFIKLKQQNGKPLFVELTICVEQNCEPVYNYEIVSNNEIRYLDQTCKLMVDDNILDEIRYVIKNKCQSLFYHISNQNDEPFFIKLLAKKIEQKNHKPRFIQKLATEYEKQSRDMLKSLNLNSDLIRIHYTLDDIKELIKDRYQFFFQKNRFLDDDVRDELFKLFEKYMKYVEPVLIGNDLIFHLLQQGGGSFIEKCDEYDYINPLVVADIYEKNFGNEEIIDDHLDAIRIEKCVVLKSLKDDCFKIKTIYDNNKESVQYHLYEGSDYQNHKMLINNLVKLIIETGSKLLDLSIHSLSILISKVLGQTPFNIKELYNEISVIEI